jgi:hypothetical protein
MSDDLNPAVTTLQRKLDEQLKAASETKKVINMLLKSMGKPEQYHDVSDGGSAVRADQFYGKPLATAAQQYLEFRQQACQPDEILQGMLAGGFDFDRLGWKENDRLRSLSISLAKNNVKFHRLKNGSFGLVGWYDKEFLLGGTKNDTPRAPKKRPKKKKGSKAKEKIRKGESKTLCSRGCGKPTHRGGCRPVANNLTTSAKTKSQPNAESDSGKEKKE